MDHLAGALCLVLYSLQIHYYEHSVGNRFNTKHNPLSKPYMETKRSQRGFQVVPFNLVINFQSASQNLILCVTHIHEVL